MKNKLRLIPAMIFVAITLSMASEIPAKEIQEVLKSTEQCTVSGTVTDEYGNPIAGVTVLVKGTSTGTITDTQGHYVISYPCDEQILIFSFIGYESLEAVIWDQSVVDVTLFEDAQGVKRMRRSSPIF